MAIGVVVVIWLFCAAGAAAIARAKGRDWMAFFLWGLVGGIFGVAYALLARPALTRPGHQRQKAAAHPEVDGGSKR